MSNNRRNNYITGIKNMVFSNVTEQVISLYQLKRTKTTELMTTLRHNDCYYYTEIEGSVDALILHDFPGGDVIYIVSKNNRKFEFKYPEGICGEARMTDLKRNDIFFDIIRLLKSCDSKTTVLTADNKLLRISNKPFLLNAMTNYDKNYGNIYHGEDLVEEGNLYGDTSEFYIIGYIDYLDYISNQ